MKAKDYSSLYRVMHWTIAIVMILLLITIFLRLTWMNRDHVAGIIGEFLVANDQHLSQEQLVVLAKTIRKPMWDWHIYLGYGLVGLFSLRFLLPLFGKMPFQNPLEQNLNSKQKLHRWAYIVFYICVALSLITGLIIKFGPVAYKKTMESIHELSIYYFVGYLILHIGGVLYAEFTSEKGIISKIISGSKGLLK